MHAHYYSRIDTHREALPSSGCLMQLAWFQCCVWECFFVCSVSVYHIVLLPVCVTGSAGAPSSVYFSLFFLPQVPEDQCLDRCTQSARCASICLWHLNLVSAAAVQPSPSERVYLISCHFGFNTHPKLLVKFDQLQWKLFLVVDCWTLPGKPSPELIFHSSSWLAHQPSPIPLYSW